MPKKTENADQAGETVELQGSDAKRAENSTRRQGERNSRSRNVKIIILAVVCCLILVALCGWYVYKTLSEEDRGRGMIETIPGLYHHPESSRSPDGLIAYRVSDMESYRKWTDVIDRFLDEYRTPGRMAVGHSSYVNCDYNNSPKMGQVCVVDLRVFGPCSAENYYGYHRGSPCVFLKLNKIKDWVPEFYNDTSILPENMPDYLKEHIRDLEVREPSHLNTVWVSCEGDTSADVELIGPISYKPENGFPGYFFPYRENLETYLSPLVALHLERPTYGVVINIECRLWARNIKYNREEGTGFVHFQLLMD